MNFDHSSEHLHLRKSIREFALAEIAPHVLAWDEANEFPLDVVRKLGALGCMGSVFPEEYGGAGLDYIDYCGIIEELSRVDPSVGLIVAAHTSLCSNHIYLAGSEEQRQRYLPRLATGEWLGSWALTEPESGSDAGSMRSTAALEGSDWVLNGTKTFCTNVHYAQINVAMMITDRSASQHGVSAFLVETDTPGFHLGRKENKLGMRASATGEIRFDNCRVPASQLCGRAGEGFIDSLRILDGGRISIAALSIGIAQGAYDAALKYSKQRKQFGRFISEFQAIQHKLADMATSIEAAKMLTYRAAWMHSNKQNVNRESSMAKLFASEMAVRVCEEAVQIHGGYGFVKDYGVEKFFRDVKLCTIGEGTSEIQRLVIARQLLKA